MNGNSSIGPEPQRLEPQQHAREPRAQDLGLRERGPRREVLLGVQPHADAGRETAAATRALDRVRLRDRLDAQALHAVPRAVAADAREPRVDHVADPRHGQRRLGDVRREHDARRLARLEDSPLPRRREARVERQQLVALRAEPLRARARRRGSSARRAGTRACRGSRSESTRLRGELARRVDDGRREVLIVGARAVANRRPEAAARDANDRRAAEMLARSARGRSSRT